MGEPVGRELAVPIVVGIADNPSPLFTLGVNVDVDADGAPDVNIAWEGSRSAYQGLASGPRAASGSVLLDSPGVVLNPPSVVRRYEKGETIGPAGLVLSGASGSVQTVFESLVSQSSGGEFFPEEKREGYLGFAFRKGTVIHWGWLEVAIDLKDPADGYTTVLAHGYETLPDTGVIAGAGVVKEFRVVELAMVPEGIRLGWEADPGAAYQVEGRNDLTGSRWSPVGDRVVTVGTLGESILPASGLLGANFLRVRRLQ